MNLNIQRVLINQLQKNRESTQTLRIGQIINGEILKLYPNNRAHIQLGTNQLIAQLEASLEIGERYHFQVESKDSLIHLKVIGENLSNKSQSNVFILLQQLGMKTTKLNQAFVSSLFEHKVAFDRGQLQQALLLLEGAPNKEIAPSLLREMIANRIPLNNAIFEALSTRAMGSFSEHIKVFESALQQNHTISNSNKYEILQQLQNLAGSAKQVPGLQVILNNPDMFTLLKAFGAINQDISFANWSNQVRTSSIGIFSELNLFQYEQIQYLMSNRSNLDVLQKNAQSIVNRFGDYLKLNSIKGTPLPTDFFKDFTQEMIQKVFPFTKNQSIQLVNNPQQLQHLLNDLEVLAKPATYSNLDNFLYHFIKGSFTDQIRNVLQHVGLQFENDILHDKNPTNTLKASLLQLVQSGDNASFEQANKLLQFINGMQIQSVSETDRFIQANLIIPAGSLGMEHDVEMKFEGKKNEDGEIDPDFCRIIFYLDLSNIGHTVVDMYVQKRAISISILNDHPIGNITNLLKPKLKDGLEKMNYHLSSVSLKPLTKQELDPTNKSLTNTHQSSYKGVDLRI